MKRALVLTILVIAPHFSHSQAPYKLPPKEVVDILDASPTPLVFVSPRNNALLMVEYRAQPPIALVARPFLRLGGVRIDPALNARQRLTEYTGFVIRWFDGEKTVRVVLPEGSRIGIPVWSNDGTKLAFTRDGERGVELWVAEAATGEAHAIPNVRVNDVLGSPIDWMVDNVSLLVRLVPEGLRRAPEAPKAPIGPDIEEAAGKVSKVWTYEDMLKNAYDEKLFQFYAETQLAVVNSATGVVKQVGSPALILSGSFSPDEKYLLVTEIHEPFSHRVPYYLFARRTEIWNPQGTIVRTIADLGISDQVPTQGVPTGPRNVQWQPLYPAKLLWVEALDGGDPLTKVLQRDKVMTLAAPFDGSPAEVLKIQHRFSGFDWINKRDEVILTEFSRERRWRTSTLLNLQNPSAGGKVTSDLSVNDAYHDPGRPVYETRPDGEQVMLQDGDWIYLSGSGASEQGDRPFLDRMNLVTLKKERLYRSDEKSLGRFVSFVKDSRSAIVMRYETPTEAANYFVMDLKFRARRGLTAFKDPAPQLTGMKKELVKYTRPDGVPLSGTLYLPPGYRPGTRLPLVVWAYPLEYSDAGTAGQVRGSPNSFTFLRGPSPLFFVTQGYAVLMDATMPVVGDPETMNNTFVEQIVSSAKAAIDKLDSMGVIDRRRALVAGHSYGAFMTANLLAHSDLFAAGIARSGAYNRTLTPFGFQSERRSFWEAPDLYMKVSPFMYADKINEPILLIHGEADNNSGTFPIQSERLFEAIKGNGGIARLVLLPYESHGYSARESVLDVLAEMFEWADKYVKNRPAVGDLR